MTSGVQRLLVEPVLIRGQLVTKSMRGMQRGKGFFANAVLI